MYIHWAGAEWILPCRAQRFIEALGAATTLTVADAYSWDDSLDEPDVRSLLQQLLDAGLLVRDR